VEDRHLIVIGLGIGTGLDEQNAKTPDGEIRRQGSAAGSGADDDVVGELFVDRRVLRTS
jgi:hypothetical protein